MKGRLCFFMLALQILVWVSGATRSIPQTDAIISHPGQEEAPQSSPYATEPNKKGMAETMVEEEYERRGAGKVGSSPPRCEHKCYGCTPCEAIQVPSISRRSHLAIQYANYEPESWKCKCGPSFYSP
ncbi:EPIDERMAL PATTERNING FACTOR-like protein 6 [Prosopis cineraria]|uniref:EPIDERMAL PATTERNING FACTOR-like protein 6 n=1 Tax=Prosopis cineraria TaxID=364024 RepID=UPI0024105DAD|nr:EPIDERMAL PATTERNING FACTOR-like protein 6 [Prosopis cineraria]